MTLVGLECYEHGRHGHLLNQVGGTNGQTAQRGRALVTEQCSVKGARFRKELSNRTQGRADMRR